MDDTFPILFNQYHMINFSSWEKFRVQAKQKNIQNQKEVLFNIVSDSFSQVVETICLHDTLYFASFSINNQFDTFMCHNIV